MRCESVERVHGCYSVVGKYAQTMLQLLDLVYGQCTWKPERLEQIVGIPVPQIEDRFLHCVKQYLEHLL